MIPLSYLPATVRGVLPQQGNGDLAFSVDTVGGPVRLRLTEVEAVKLFDWVLDAMSQRLARMKKEVA